MKKIKLTQGRFALVDDADFEYLNQWKWYAADGRYTYYAERARRQSDSPGSRIIKMHQVILGLWTDHIDGNGLNNQRINLRRSSPSQNQRHRRPQKGGTSKFKGVSWNRLTNKWSAQIHVNNQKKHLGLFVDEVEAARSYDKAAIKYFGEFAWLNFGGETS